jgi:asparagine synthase (glutamine-hydrolysing)
VKQFGDSQDVFSPIETFYRQEAAMCGICGKLSFDRAASVSPALIKSMSDAMVHRGPDDEGGYVRGPVGLGFRRLSIIDLGGGHQPLSNEDGSVWIVFNGEIYNYQELRRFLVAKGHIFQTQSDTEVIVHLYEELGETCVERLRGMFAFAIWDDRNQSLFLARDRVGIKPLYYRHSRDSFVFASEIKAILADPDFDAEVSPPMIDRFLTFYYTPGDQTLFGNIYKLLPGHTMSVRAGVARIRQYWDLDFTPSCLSLRDAEAQLLSLLEESVRLHMISDVPVGFLLSGGVDSTAMLGFAAGKTDRPISSYTIGFSDPGVTDERPYARIAARLYNSEHHEMTIAATDFADFLPKYVWHMEEPVCEPPAVALFYVSKLAKAFVKVLISGEGGDEAFAGYSNYRSLLWLDQIKQLPSILSRSVFAGMSLLDASRFAKYRALSGWSLQDSYYSRTSTPLNFFNRSYLELYSSDFARSVDKQASTQPVSQYLRNANANDSLAKMLYTDTKTWLPDDLLIKADKMTMANSVELRVPFLDHKVLEFAASLPSNFKVHGWTTKYIVKKTLNGRVPKKIVNRKKTGFPVPYEKWLRTDLKDWVRDILLDSKTLSRGYFQRAGVEKLLTLDSNHGSGGYSKEIFSLAVLELWHREFLDQRPLPRPEQPTNPASLSLIST